VSKFTDPATRAWVQKYLGTNKPTLCTPMGDIKRRATDILRESISTPTEFYQYIDNLCQHGQTFEDLALAASVFGQGTKYRQKFDLTYLDKWLNYTVGWAEVDSLCQSNFTATELLDYWTKWQKFLDKLSTDKNIHKRRASLVILCKSLRQSDDSRLLAQAFKTIHTLTAEKEVLITKAISWVLRSAVKNFSNQIGKFLEENINTLPRIAYRETQKKLTTGKKT
jgi:3-methyladenine DNA glycosylase AlkD